MCIPRNRDFYLESIETPVYELPQLIPLEDSFLARLPSVNQQRRVPGYPVIIITDTTIPQSDYDSTPDYANVDQSALLPAGWDMWRGPPDEEI